MISLYNFKSFYNIGFYAPMLGNHNYVVMPGINYLDGKAYVESLGVHLEYPRSKVHFGKIFFEITDEELDFIKLTQDILTKGYKHLSLTVGIIDKKDLQ